MFKCWYSKYDVIEVKNDRIVIGIGNTVTAAVNAANLAAA
jgi:muramidase (flagellum-specific)